ncbi:hypothetical protein [Streptomyces sp. B29(2018)]|uniref:hypothetical protein n=1 Tax=Streptomyces sp. B29(2018) TaxID=2485016 RepID=UPI000FD6295F|nr:hypothetical protein [Streptomyces sp. B29(2018)]
MGPYASPARPRRTPAVDTLRALVPETADVIRVRAATPTAATSWTWTRAEVLGSYQWPPYPGEALRPLDRTADDSTHAGLTVCEFLAAHQYAGNVRLVRAGDATYTFSIILSRPRWEDWDET